MKVKSAILIILSLLIVSCGKNKYPENYGVYFADNLKSINKIEVNNYYTEIDFEKLSATPNDSKIALIFYDPQILSTELLLIRSGSGENIKLHTRPVDGKLGMFIIELNQLVEDGIYFLYENKYNLSNNSMKGWFFIVGSPKKESTFKNEIVGKWMTGYNSPVEFLKNGQIKEDDDEIIGKYNFFGPDPLNIEIADFNGKAKILFISDNLLLIKYRQNTGKIFHGDFYRQN